MTEAKAREMIPGWAEQPTKVYEPKKAKKEPEKQTKRRLTFRIPDLTWVKRRYGILLIMAGAFTLYTIILGSAVHAKTEKTVRQEMAFYYASELEKYKAELAEAEQAAHWLSGEASREAFINQEIEYGAKLISKEANDQVKGTKLGVALARVMNRNYPDTIQEVAEQPQQWMFYSSDNKVTEHDLEIAEKILRPYYEQGIVPNGLTSEMVYFQWSGDTGTARDSYETTTSMSTWRYQG